MIQCYAAPMEGITGYVYRNTHARHFTGIDKYFTPFITPRIKKMWMNKERNDIIPEHNTCGKLVPQILTNKAEELVTGAENLFDMGYSEVNINLGCPSGTVVSKGRGSGFLKETDALRYFFDEYFKHCQVPLSVKTRLGLKDSSEFPSILEIYNEFPFREVIVHARVREDFYKNPVNHDAFAKAYEECRHPLCYNGDINRQEDLEVLKKKFPDLSFVMIGRGMIANPQLSEQLKTGCGRDLKRIKAFMDDLCQSYEQVLYGDKNALFKMKEIWSYMIDQFDNIGKYEKKIKKSKTLTEYRAIVDALFEEQMVSEIL